MAEIQFTLTGRDNTSQALQSVTDAFKNLSKVAEGTQETIKLGSAKFEGYRTALSTSAEENKRLVAVVERVNQALSIANSTVATTADKYGALGSAASMIDHAINLFGENLTVNGMALKAYKEEISNLAGAMNSLYQVQKSSDNIENLTNKLSQQEAITQGLISRVGEYDLQLLKLERPLEQVGKSASDSASFFEELGRYQDVLAQSTDRTRAAFTAYDNTFKPLNATIKDGINSNTNLTKSFNLTEMGAFTVRGEFQRAQKAFNDYSGTVGSVRTALTQVTNDMGKYQNATGITANATDTLKNNMTLLAVIMGQQLKSAMNSIANSEIVTQFKELAQVGTLVSNGFNLVKESVSTVASEFQNSLGNAIGKVSPTLGEMVKNLSPMQVGLLAVGAAAVKLGQSIAGIVWDGIKKGVDLIGTGVKKMGSLFLDGAKSMVQFGDEINRQEKVWSTLFRGSEVDVNKFMEATKKLAIDTPYSFEEVSSSLQKMKASGVEAGENGKNLQDVFMSLSDIAVATGGSVDRITKAYTDIKAAGKGTAQDMRQLTEAGVPAWEALGAAMQKSGKISKDMVAGSDKMNAKLREMSKNSELTAEDFSGMWKELDNMFGGATQAQMMTFSNQFQRAMEGIKTATAPIGQAISKALAQPISKVGDYVESTMGKFVTMGENVTKALEPLQSMLGEKFVEIFKVLEDIGIGFFDMFMSNLDLIGPALDTVRNVFVLLGNALLGVGEIATGAFRLISEPLNTLLGLVDGLISRIRDSWANMMESDAGPRITDSFNRIMDALKPVFDVLGDIAQVLIEEVMPNFIESMASAIEQVSPLLTLVGEVLVGLGKIVAKLMEIGNKSEEVTRTHEVFNIMKKRLNDANKELNITNNELKNVASATEEFGVKIEDISDDTIIMLNDELRNNGKLSEQSRGYLQALSNQKVSTSNVETFNTAVSDTGTEVQAVTKASEDLGLQEISTKEFKKVLDKIKEIKTALDNLPKSKTITVTVNYVEQNKPKSLTQAGFSMNVPSPARSFGQENMALATANSFSGGSMSTQANAPVMNVSAPYIDQGYMQSMLKQFKRMGGF